MMDDGQVGEDSQNASAPMQNRAVAQESAVLADGPGIASWWHTAGILSLLAGWAVLGHGQHRQALANEHLALYFSSAMMSWMLLGSSIAGIRDRQRFFAATLRNKAQGWIVELGIGAAIYFGFLFAIAMIAAALYALHHHSMIKADQNVVRALAPQNAREMLTWVLLSVSAGVCEELVFRGYLLQQGIAWMRRISTSPKIASVLAAAATSVLFGSLHLYEGTSGAAFVTLLGFTYAIVVLWRGNLRAVMIAHTMQDLFAGLMLFALRHAKF